MDNNIILSICIPTYNRGKIAFSLVQELDEIANKYCGKIEIVISDNGSDKYREEYDSISNLLSEHLIYFRFDSNRGFVHNFNQVIRLSKGRFCLILSDEDHVTEKGLAYYLEYLITNPHIGMIRGATDRMYANQEKGYYKSGRDAVDGYFLQGNYISGIIYNRSILTNEIVDSFEQKYNTNEAYISYPHMFLEAYMCLEADVYKGKEVLIHEGDGQDDQEKDTDTNILKYSTIESRINQAKGYLELIGYLNTSNGIKLKMVTDVICKTFQLLFFQYRKYEIFGIECHDLMCQITIRLNELFDKSDIHLIKQEKAILREYTEAVRDSYIREYELIIRAQKPD